MDKPTLRDSVKHPEKMGPLGDAADRPRKAQPSKDQPKKVRDQAWMADREQLTTSE
jgi:hypothetical protein